VEGGMEVWSMRASDNMTHGCTDVTWANEIMTHGCMDDDVVTGDRLWAQHVAYGLTVQVT
jgi:hypothetical protein